MANVLEFNGTNVDATTTPSVTSISLSTPLAIASGGTNASSMTNTDGVCYFDSASIVLQL